MNSQRQLTGLTILLATLTFALFANAAQPDKRTGELKAARAELAKADPSKQSALRLALIDRCIEVGRPMEAIPEINIWFKANLKSPEREKVFQKLITAQRLSGEFDAAAGTSRTFLREFPNSADRIQVLRDLVEIARYGQQNLVSESTALADLVAAEPAGPARKNTLLRLAKVQEQSGDAAGAVTTLQKFATEFARDDYADAAGWRAVVILHDRLRRTADALAAGQAHLKKYPKRPTISADWQYLGTLARAIEKPSESIACFFNAAQADPRNRDAAQALVDAAEMGLAPLEDLPRIRQLVEKNFPETGLGVDVQIASLRRQFAAKKIEAKAAITEAANLLDRAPRAETLCAIMERATEELAQTDKTGARVKLQGIYRAHLSNLKGPARSEVAIRLSRSLLVQNKFDEPLKILEAELKENPADRRELTLDYLRAIILPQLAELREKKRQKLDIEAPVKALSELVQPIAYMTELRRGFDEAATELNSAAGPKQREAVHLLRQQMQELSTAELAALVDTVEMQARADVGRAADALALLEGKAKDKPGIFEALARPVWLIWERAKDDNRAKILPWLAAWSQARPANLALAQDVGDAFRRLARPKDAAAVYQRIISAKPTPQNAPYINAALGCLIDLEAYEFRTPELPAKLAAFEKQFNQIEPLLAAAQRHDRHRQLAQIHGRTKEGAARQIAEYRKASEGGMSDVSLEAVRGIFAVLPPADAVALGKKLLADPANDKWYPALALLTAHKQATGLKDLAGAVPLLVTAQDKRETGFRIDFDDQNLLREVLTLALDLSDSKRPMELSRRQSLEGIKPLDPQQMQSLLTVSRRWLSSVALDEAAREAIRLQAAGGNIPAQLDIFNQTLARTPPSRPYQFERYMEIVREQINRGNDGAASTMLRVLLKQSPQATENARTNARNLLVSIHTRMGEDLLAAADKTPIAPLLRGASFLKLGEEKKAWELYIANKELFATRIDQVPSDYLLYVANELGTGTDADRDAAEQLLRTWLVRKEKDTELDPTIKAAITLKLADVYYYGRRFDVARAEYTSLRDKFPDSPQATESLFRIGESFMYQKNYPEAAKIFDGLRKSKDPETAMRGTFMAGVLLYTQGSREEARDAFKSLLDLSPPEDLASKTLYQLALIYGDDNRFREMLDMLEAIGRIGREGKKWHTPGTPLTIMIHDPDMAIVQEAATVPVVVTTTSGDREMVYLTAGAAGRGIYLTELPTALGAPKAGDHVLQLLGNDIITYDYPDEFKSRFRYVPPPQGNIRIASDATLKASSKRIVDEQLEKPSAIAATQPAKIEREDEEVHQFRSGSEVKPGNPIYVRVTDPDRSISTGVNRVEVQVRAASGDVVRTFIPETGPNTGIFEGIIKTADRPREAVASDSAMGRPAAMAVDKDPKSAWESQHDGQSGKWIAADLKDVFNVTSFSFATPAPAAPPQSIREATLHLPTQWSIETSLNGVLWEPVCGTDKAKIAHGLTLSYGQMRVTRYSWSKIKSAVGLTASPENLDQYMAMLSSGKLPVGASEVLTTLVLPETKRDEEGDIYIVAGYFYQPTAAKQSFAVRGGKHPGGALVIDGRIIAARGSELRSATAIADLTPGWHRFAAFITNHGEGPTPLAIVFGNPNVKVDSALVVPSGSDNPMPAPGPWTVPAEAKVTTQDRTTRVEIPSVPARFVRLNILAYEGDYVTLSNMKVEGDSGKLLLPTGADVLSMSEDDVLQLSPGDEISVSYIDQINTKTPGDARELSTRLTASYYNATIRAVAYDVNTSEKGDVSRTAKELYRIDAGDRIVAIITDYDEDTTPEPDKIKFEARTDSGARLLLEATETGPTTGIFSKEIETGDGPGKLKVLPGESVYLIYRDRLNTNPGSPTDRSTVVAVATPSDGTIGILPSRVEPRGTPAKPEPPSIVYLPSKPGEMSRVVLAAPLTIEVFDPDAAKDTHSIVNVELKTSGGAKLTVPLELSEAVRPLSDTPRPAPGGKGPVAPRETAASQGRFVGQVLLVLGRPDAEGKNTEAVPLERARNLVGAWRYAKASDTGTVAAPILPINGADIITATYIDKHNTTGASVTRQAQARMVTDATLANLDRSYTEPVSVVHLGEKLFLRLEDGDRDATPELDTVNVTITSNRGEKLSVKLTETLSHSGVFTAEVPLIASDKPDPNNDKLEATFGDELTIAYIDESNTKGSTPVEVKTIVNVAVGSNATLLAFTKQFGDREMAIETQFKLAECYFELFKSHNALKAQAEARQALEAGRAILASVRDTYRGSNYEARVLFLLGSFHLELKEFDKAIDAFGTIVRAYPNSGFAPDAQYKLGQCHEGKGDMNLACEEYVRLAYTYPDNPLIAKCMVRLSDYFYKSTKFLIAANVCLQFVEQYPEHELAARIAYRQGQCYYKAAEALANPAGTEEQPVRVTPPTGKVPPKIAELYRSGAKAFDLVVDRYPDSDLRAEAMYWAGQCYHKAGDFAPAYRRYRRCTWDFPDTEAARFARGQLTLPEIANVEEKEREK